MEVLFTSYTPVHTNAPPINRESVRGSFKMRMDSVTAKMGTKFMNRPAFVGPILFTPS